MGAWRRLLCAKQVISLVETMKLVFFSRSIRPDDFRVSRLAVDDLHGSLLVNAHSSRRTHLKVKVHIQVEDENHLNKDLQQKDRLVRKT
ncbi:hypothetical protein YC2023_114519 [Brassica napus]